MIHLLILINLQTWDKNYFQLSISPFFYPENVVTDSLCYSASATSVQA